MDAKLEDVFLRARRLEDTEQDGIRVITVAEVWCTLIRWCSCHIWIYYSQYHVQVLILFIHVVIIYYLFRTCINYFCFRGRGQYHEGQGMDANGQIIDATTIEGAIEKLLDEKIVLYKDYTSRFTCVEKNDTETTCSICLEEYKENDSVFFGDCHHLFHRECIEKWLKQHDRKCPYCRMVMISNEELAMYSQ